MSFYLDDINAKGNRKFWRFVKKVDDWEAPNSALFWDSFWAAWHCHKSKKRNRVYKGEKRKLIDLWWSVYYLRGIKLNGVDLGHLYLKTRSS